MTTLDLALLAAIDQRLSLAQERITAIGVIAAVTGVDDAMVAFDGSTMAVPVKLAGDADFMPGDRVALGKFGLWWVALVPLTHRWPSSNGTSVPQTSSGTTSAGTYTDVPTATAVTFTKRWDATSVWVMITGNAWSAAALPAGVAFGANFSSGSQPAIATYDVATMELNVVNQHEAQTNWIKIAGLAADTYTVKVQWKRSSGTATFTTDLNDTISLYVMETPP